MHSKTSADIPRKPKLNTRNVVLVENNYEDAPPQGDSTSEYSDSKKTVKMTWKSTKDGRIHKRGSENIFKNNPGPRRLAKSVKSPLASCKLFFTDVMIRSIVQHTNNCI